MTFIVIWSEEHMDKPDGPKEPSKGLRVYIKSFDIPF